MVLLHLNAFHFIFWVLSTKYLVEASLPLPLQRNVVPLPGRNSSRSEKDVFLDSLVSNMTVPEMVLQLHLMFADNVVGPFGDNSYYDLAIALAPTAGVGIMHDWYPTNKSQYNSVQRLNAQKSRFGIPIMQYGECLHGVGSFKQSMFPQTIGMSASFDTNLVHRIGRAIGEEASSIGIHACLSPVLDLALEPRWGRVQENWGEDTLLTSMMGVAMASGLSKNSTWSDPDAVVPVMKHFAAHGSPQAGVNAAPAMILGYRQVLQNMLRPFKAVFDLGGARGVLMAYSELDGIPSSVHPFLYKCLEDWGFDGFVTADDAGLVMLEETHKVSNSPADTIGQWLNAGGMIQYYDYPLDVFLESIEGLVANGTVTLSTLQSRVKSVLRVKYDLGLFSENGRYIADDIDSEALTRAHVPLTLEAAQKSIVLLENRDSTLPLQPLSQNISKIALIGPFIDILNYGDYSGQFGAYPTANSSTIRQGIKSHLAANAPSVQLVSSWGANTWYYNAQYGIPGYLLSSNGTSGGLTGTYYADTNFSEPIFQVHEVPERDWGLYPPNGLPSNNFSVVWEGELEVPVDVTVEGWLGVGVGPNATAKLFIDDFLVQDSVMTSTGNLASNIPGYAFTLVNSTLPPAGSAPFTFVPGKVHKIRLEFQVWNLYQKIENQSSLNGQVFLFWNLVDKRDAVQQAVDIASSSDIIILAVGANWNSDGENGDRATLSLSTNQTALADAIFAIGKPVILVLEGGRPFAIPEYYSRAAAVLNAYFPGQSGGQAIADVLFGRFNPGGRLPVSVPYGEGILPDFYSYKASARAVNYVDSQEYPSYPFGYGLSYTTFSTSSFTASSSSANSSNSSANSFLSNTTITFSVTVKNNGTLAGSYVTQVYLLQRHSSVSQPVKQLVAFTRLYLDAGETNKVQMTLEVDRFLPILNRNWEWELEMGEYVFALLENGGHDADTGVNVTMVCV